MNTDRLAGLPIEGFLVTEELPVEFKLARSRLMYIEDKSMGLEGEASIGRVYFRNLGKRFITEAISFEV